MKVEIFGSILHLGLFLQLYNQIVDYTISQVVRFVISVPGWDL